MNRNEHNLMNTVPLTRQTTKPMNNIPLLTTNAQPTPVTENCPWVRQRHLPRQFAEIETKIRQQEQVKLSESGKQLRTQLEAEHAAELTRQRQLGEQQLEKAVQSKLKEMDAERQKLYSDQVAAIQKDRDELFSKFNPTSVARRRVCNQRSRIWSERL